MVACLDCCGGFGLASGFCGCLLCLLFGVCVGIVLIDFGGCGCFDGVTDCLFPVLWMLVGCWCYC